jgi:hypothetical protein
MVTRRAKSDQVLGEGAPMPGVSGAEGSPHPPTFPARPPFLSVDLGVWSAPVDESRRKFAEIQSWLYRLGAADLQRVASCARHFHPGPCAMAGEAPARVLYLQMERGHYDIETIKTLAPTMAAGMPKQARGVPWEYRFNVLAVSGMLAAYEWAQISLVTGGVKPVAELSIHLYCFERFAGLWFRVAASAPPSMWFNKRSRAVDWRSELGSFSSDYFSRNPRNSASACAEAFVAAGTFGAPGRDAVYRSLLQIRKINK